MNRITATAISTITLVALTGSAAAASAAPSRFRSPDGSVYCVFSHTEPVVNCYAGWGKAFRGAWLTPGPASSTNPGIMRPPKWTAPSAQIRRGPRLPISAEVQDPFLSDASATLKCAAITGSQVTCWGTTPDSTGFTIRGGCTANQRVLRTAYFEPRPC